MRDRVGSLAHTVSSLLSLYDLSIFLTLRRRDIKKTVPNAQAFETASPDRNLTVVIGIAAIVRLTRIFLSLHRLHKRFGLFTAHVTHRADKTVGAEDRHRTDAKR